MMIHLPKYEKTQYAGIIFAVLAAMFVGSTNVIGKAFVSPDFFQSNTNPLSIVLFTSLVAGIMFSYPSKKKERLGGIKKNTLLTIVVMGAFDAIAVVLAFYGLQYLNAVDAIILGDIEIVFSVMIAMFVFREKIMRNEYVPLIMILTGSILVPFISIVMNSETEFSVSMIGVILIVTSALFYAMDVWGYLDMFPR